METNAHMKQQLQQLDEKLEPLEKAFHHKLHQENVIDPTLRMKIAALTEEYNEIIEKLMHTSTDELMREITTLVPEETQVQEPNEDEQGKVPF